MPNDPPDRSPWRVNRIWRFLVCCHHPHLSIINVYRFEGNHTSCGRVVINGLNLFRNKHCHISCCFPRCLDLSANCETCTSLAISPDLTWLPLLYLSRHLSRPVITRILSVVKHFDCHKVELLVYGPTRGQELCCNCLTFRRFCTTFDPSSVESPDCVFVQSVSKHIIRMWICLFLIHPSIFCCYHQW